MKGNRFNFLVLIFGFLSGCESQYISVPDRSNEMYEFARMQTNQCQKGDVGSLLQTLQFANISVHQVGNDIRIIFPTDLYFYPHSPRLMPKSYYYLDCLAEYLNKYRKIAVNIEGYTNSETESQKNIALSTERTENLGRYLWSKGTDTRVMLSRGLGSCHPIVKEELSGQNNRIEILMRIQTHSTF